MMDIAGTISNILESNYKFDHLFWTSYSMDPTSIDFLYKNDLRRCLNFPYFHFICDKKKLDETIDHCFSDAKKIHLLSRMQGYICISHESLEGAFHPKILFFSGKETVKCLVLSGNATSSGILSNQDMVAELEWRSNDDSGHFKPEIASIYQFLCSFQNWNDESRYELDAISKIHPWLNELNSDSVFYTKADSSLLDQISKAIPKKEFVEKIIVFSPFVDPDLKGLISLADRFSGAEVLLYMPEEEVQLNNPDQSIPKNIQIRSASTLKKPRFHAKYYAFFGNKINVGIWGSANCSFSALLSTTRNREILLKYDLTKDSLNNLWPGINDTNGKSVKFVKLMKPNQEEESMVEVEILDGRINDGRIELRFENDFERKLVCILNFDGQTIPKGPLSSKDKMLQLDLEETHKICGVYICNSSEEKISNSYFLINYLKVKRNIEGTQSSSSFENLKTSKAKFFRGLGEFFVLDSGESKIPTGKGGVTLDPDNAFWRMPRYSSRNAGLGIFGFRAYMRGYVSRHKVKVDIDGDENTLPDADLKVGKTQSEGEFSPFAKIALKIFNLVNKSKNDKAKLLRIPLDRWIKGLEYLIRYLLEMESQYDALKDKDLNHISIFLDKYLKIVLFILEKEELESDEESIDFIKSIYMMSCFYVLISKYFYQKTVAIVGILNSNEEYKKYIKNLADAQFMKVKAQSLLTEYDLGCNYEVQVILLEEVAKKISNTRAANSALLLAQSTIKIINDIDFEENDVVLLNEQLYLLDGMIGHDRYKLITCLGESKEFSAKIAKPVRIHRFRDMIL